MATCQLVHECEYRERVVRIQDANDAVRALALTSAVIRKTPVSATGVKSGCWRSRSLICHRRMMTDLRRTCVLEKSFARRAPIGGTDDALTIALMHEPEHCLSGYHLFPAPRRDPIVAGSFARTAENHCWLLLVDRGCDLEAILCARIGSHPTEQLQAGSAGD
jgi:hypothetical protein